MKEVLWSILKLEKGRFDRLSKLGRPSDWDNQQNARHVGKGQQERSVTVTRLFCVGLAPTATWTARNYSQTKKFPLGARFGKIIY